MEMVKNSLDIAASLLSIFATVLAIFATVRANKNKKEIEHLYNLYEGNTQKLYGNGNNQIIGMDNRVVGHGE